jgi:CDP-diacylglycerol--glycerol-3-phosphate 3-phosphatidyltransferase
MLSERLRRYTRGIREPAGRALGQLGLTPNALTLLGYALNLVVMYVLAQGQLRVGGAMVLAAGLFDALDGAVARATGQTSTFGAFLDSVVDRYSEATVLLGLLLWYLSNGATLEPALIYAVIVGSLMVSYARARAEGVGLECKIGLMTRLERVALLSVGLMARQPRITLSALAILTNLTALQRIAHVWRETRQQPHTTSHRD